MVQKIFSQLLYDLISTLFWSTTIMSNVLACCIGNKIANNLVPSFLDSTLHMWVCRKMGMGSSIIGCYASCAGTILCCLTYFVLLLNPHCLRLQNLFLTTLQRTFVCTLRTLQPDRTFIRWTRGLLLINQALFLCAPFLSKMENIHLFSSSLRNCQNLQKATGNICDRLWHLSRRG